jgi:hypothetical protein
MKDTKSLLLALLSLGLVGTWIYHLYDKTIYSKQVSQVHAKDPVLVSSTQDSIKQVYNSIAQKLDTGIHFASNISDTLTKNDQLTAKLELINNLKNDISIILNDPEATSIELDLARQKITTLQQKTEELRNDKTVMEEKKKQMTAIFEKITSEIDDEEKNVKKLEGENKEITQKITKASTFTASKLRFVAMSNSGASEKETSEARKTEKFALSFTVENKAVQYNNAEVYVVVIKPDGQVLQSGQVWESGSFDSPGGGRKNYTLKVRFEYNKGEPKPLLLMLNAENYQKGNYKMQVYHNGILIGQTIKKLT